VLVSAHRAGVVITHDCIVTSSRFRHRILKSTDYGATFSVLYTMPDPGGTPQGYGIEGLHIPYHANADDEIIYFSWRNWNGVAFLSIYDHGTVTLLDTPSTTGTPDTNPLGNTGMDSSVIDRTKLRAMMQRLYFVNQDGQNGGYAQSDDSGATWNPSNVTSTNSRSIAIAGDNPDVQWRWGDDGTLEQTTDDGANWSDVSGDLPGNGAAGGDNRLDSIWGL
jgi:hypothetical protein